MYSDPLWNKGCLRERVLFVFRDYLSDLRPEEFDGNVRLDFEKLMKCYKAIIDRTTQKAGPSNLKVQMDRYGHPFAIVKEGIRERTAEKIARSIFSLYMEIQNQKDAN